MEDKGFLIGGIVIILFVIAGIVCENPNTTTTEERNTRWEQENLKTSDKQREINRIRDYEYIKKYGSDD